MNSDLRFIRVAALVPCLLLAAQATELRAEEPRAPAALKCIYLPEQLSFRAQRGFLKVTWEWRLEKGPYVSEKEDDQGTYYRAPPGGMFAGRLDSLDRPSGPLTHRTSDGGVWVPRDPSVPPRLYTYFSTEDAPKVVPADSETCSSLVVVRDPATAKVSAVNFAAVGAVAGVVARPAMSIAPVSSGQAAAGGALGGAVLAALINMDVGKIIFKPIDDQSLVAKLRDLAAHATPVKEGAAETKQ